MAVQVSEMIFRLSIRPDDHWQMRKIMGMMFRRRT